MTEKFQAELSMLKQEVLDMGALVKDMLTKSIEALERHDTALAASVLTHKKQIAEYDVAIEQRCLTLLVRYQPMAKDMRTIATCLKLNTYLYRIGRYGKDIANLVPELSGLPHIVNLVSILHMTELVAGMIQDSLNAFDREDTEGIRDIPARDSTVEALRYSISRECITYMLEDPRNITRCSNYLMIARYLECCGDHACKIAEKVHYMVTGEREEFK